MSVMYIFVNSDLNMNRGRTASQVGHAVHAVIEKILLDSLYITPIPKYCLDYENWRKHPTKIVLKSTSFQLEELSKRLDACSFIDETVDGIKELTAVALFPSNSLSFSDFKLY